VPQTQEGYDTQWSVDYGKGDRAGKGRDIETHKRQGCHAVIGPGDKIRGLAIGAAKDGYRDCCGRRVQLAGIFKVRLDDGSVLTCYRCGLHGGQSAGGYTGMESGARDCKCPGCSKPKSGKAQIENPIGDQPKYWFYSDNKCLAADAPRRALFDKIRTALGWDDPDVQAMLTALDKKHNKVNDNMPFDTALAQLNTILAAGTLQALQDALDAGPSGANGP
jgi:hypothetical protein